MTELFLTYEKSFRKSEDDIKKNFQLISLADSFSKNLTNSSSDENVFNISNSLQAIEKKIVEQGKLIKQMEAAMSTQNNQEEYMRNKEVIGQFYKKIAENKKEFKIINEKNKKKIDNEDKGLTKSNSFGYDYSSEKSTFTGYQKLQEAQRILSYTEDMGGNIISNMDEQSHIMKNVSKKISNMNGDLDESNSILNVMKNRVRNNKKIIYAFGFILFVILIIFLTIKIL